MEKELVSISIKAKGHSYSPYSKFKVGAALLTQNGKIYIGANIENASFGATICAERTAVIKAVSDGENKFIAIAITSDSDNYTYPCGICRQVLSEFDKGDMKVICSNNSGKFRVLTLRELMPEIFEL
ncbi:MAG: cytidine deaminase [Bacillota bacterium]|nr:cytidine deaminase [Bacillota bacterium]